MRNYTIFDLSQLQIENNNIDTIVYTTTENEKESLVIEGHTKTSNPTLLTWNVEDTFNHSYFKYRTQKSLIGVELKFEVEAYNCISYQEINNPLNIILEFNDENIAPIKVPLGYFSDTDTFTQSLTYEGNLGEEYTIDTNISFIKRDLVNDVKKNISLSWTKEEQSGILTSLEYEVDYLTGKVTLKKDHLMPNGATLNINGIYHKSNTNYSINFSNFYSGLQPYSDDYKRVDVSNIKSIKIEVASNDDYFKFTLKNLEVELGELNTYPSNMKSNDLIVGENYDLVSNINPALLVNSMVRLGYQSFTLNLGTKGFLNTKQPKMPLISVLRPSFAKWYNLYLKEAFKCGVHDIKVIIPMDIKDLPYEWYQINKDLDTSEYLNPLNEEVFEFIGMIISELNSINTYPINVIYMLEGFEYKTLNDSLCIYNEDTIKSIEDSLYIDRTTIDDINANVDHENSIYKDIIQYLNDRLESILSLYFERFDVLPVVNYKNLINKENKYAINNISNFMREVISNSNDKFYISLEYYDNFLVDFDLSSFLKEIDIEEDNIIIHFCKIENDLDILNTWDNINDFIHNNLYSKGLCGVSISSASAIRENNCFIYKPMPYVDMKKVTIDNEIILCKANREIIGYLSNSKITNITRSITDTDEIDIEVPLWIYDRFSHQKIKNPLWDLILEERLILLNDEEYFVIKEISDDDSDGRVKNLKCYSLEHKLSKSEVVINEKSLQLHSDNGEDDGIINLLEQETGWSIGYIDSSLKFEKVDNIINSKYRWFENIDKDWLSFLNEDVSKSFDCVFQFNTLSKQVNIYSSNSLTKDKGLYLSKDNYIKSRKTTGSTNDLVTRLRCFGKEEITISTVSPNGLNYLEDYSYFIEIGDMSNELQMALSKYNSISSTINNEWKEVNTTYYSNLTTLSTLNIDKTTLEAEIKVLEGIKKSYEDDKTENSDVEIEKIQSELDTKNEKLNNILDTITLLEKEIEKANDLINSMSTQLDKKTTLDENNNPVFNTKLLSELNEFAYWGSFNDDSYDTPQALLEGSLREMANVSKPTIDYDIDSINFLQQVLNANRKYWKEVLHLGDIVTLYDDDLEKEEKLFFVGYTLNPIEKTLSIKLSNKKLETNNTKKISELLSVSKSVSRKVSKNQYLWNRVKNI